MDHVPQTTDVKRAKENAGLEMWSLEQEPYSTDGEPPMGKGLEQTAKFMLFACVRVFVCACVCVCVCVCVPDSYELQIFALT